MNIKKYLKISKNKKLPIILGIILGIFVAIFIFGAVIDSFSGGEAIKVVSAQDVFQSSENPQFVFVYKKQANIFNRFFAGVVGFFSGGNKEISTTVKIFNFKNQEIDGLNPQIKKGPRGKFAVDLDHSKFQQELRPGKYKMQIEIKDGDRAYAQEQDFRWGVLAINTNKSIYLFSEEAYFQFAALRDDGSTVCDANLKLEVRSSGFEVKTLSTEDGGIKYSGKCFGDNVTDVPDYFAHYQVNGSGKYQMTLTNLDNGFEITDYFEVRESVEFDIERIGPTRIYPGADYEMKIKIKANQDFEGEITETVPMLFAVSGSGILKQEPNSDNYTKTITWQTEIKKGEIKELNYSIDFPNISPYFYLIGPLQLYQRESAVTEGTNQRQSAVFAEQRQWQVASDAADSGDGVIVYGKSGTSTPQYQIWDSSAGSWGGESPVTGPTFSGTPRFVGVKTSHTRDEAIAGILNDSGTLYIVHWNGSAWSQLGSNITTGIGDAKVFSIVYEYTTGDAMVVVGGGADPIYYKWNGSTWSGPTTITEATKTSGTIRWIQLARRQTSSSNEIALAYADNAGDLNALIWSGSSWVEQTAAAGALSTAIENNGAATTMRAFDLQYETLSGDLLIMWGNNATVDPRYVTRTAAGSWSSVTTATAFAEIPSIVELRAEPWGNRIAIQTQDDTTANSNDGDCAVWNGDTDGFLNVGNCDTSRSSQEAGDFPMANGWIKATTDEVRALNFYSDAADLTVDYYDWSGSAWTVRTYTPSPNCISASTEDDTLALDHNPYNNAEVMILRMVGTNICAYKTNYIGGTSFGLSNAGTGSSLAAPSVAQYEVASFAYFQIIPITISGTCKQYDQLTNCSNCTGCIKAAVGSGLRSDSGDISGGSWSISILQPVANSIITVFLNDLTNNENEAIAVMEYDGAGNIDSVQLFEQHITVADGGSTTVSNADLGSYDYSVSTDEDVFFDVNGEGLNYCIISGCEKAELYISSGVIYQPNSAGGSYFETHNIEIDGTLDMTGSGNYASISGSWNNDSVFTPNSSTIFFVASDSAEIVSASSGSTNIFNSVQFGDSATTSYTGSWTLNGDETIFDVNSNLTIGAGTLVNSGTKAITLAGNLLLETNGAYTRGSGNFTFDNSGTSTWRDDGGTKADMGAVLINGSTKTINLSSSATATSVYISTDQTLSLGSSGYTLTITGSGTDDSRPLVINGTLSAGSNSLVKFTGTSDTTVQTATYYNLELSPLGGSNPTYILGRTIGDSNGTAYKINDASNFGSLPGAGRQLVRTSGGTLYVAINDGTYVEVWSSADGSSWTQQDSGDSPTGDQADGVSMAIDNSNVLHIIYAVSGDLKYVTFDTTTDQYGTPETVFSSTDIAGHDIALDSYGKPHVVAFYSNFIPKYYIDYTNKISGSWKTPIQVDTTNNDPWISCSIAIDSSDLPVISHIVSNNTNLFAEIGDQNNATVFTTVNPDSTIALSSISSSMGIDTAGNVWIAYIDATTNYVSLAVHDVAQAWTTGWASYNNTNVGNEPSVAIKGTKAYVFYESDGDDIVYDTYDGSSWLGETNLAVATYQDVKAKWSYYFNSQGNLRIGYLYSDNSDVYWNALTLGAEGTGALACNNLTIGDGVNAVTVTANTNDPDIDVGGNVTISSSAIFTASDSGALNVAGDWSNSSGTFNHSSATVIFDAGSSGKNINNGSSNFYNITFNNSSGGWTLQSTVTVVANFNILNGTVTLTSGTLNIGGNFSNTNSRTFDHNSGTVNLYSTVSRNLESGCADAGTCTNQDFYNLIINKTAVIDADDNTTLTDHLKVAGTLTITNGQLLQGNYNVRAEGASAVSVAADGEWTNIGTGDLTLGGTFANAGSVSFDTSDSDCDPIADDIQVLSTSGGSQRTWSGTGSFEMYNVYAQDMTRSDSPNITVYSGTYSNVTGNWTFTSCTVLDQTHFRWRDDDNGETNATWLRTEDQAHSSQARLDNIRLRFSVKNTGGVATQNRSYVLQVAPLGAYGYCESVPSESYSEVPTTTGGCGSSVACMTTSGNFINQDPTTAQLTVEGTWVAGKMVEDSSNQSDGVIISPNYYTEHEYNFQFTSNATNNTNYCFRVTKNGTLLDTYTKVAQVTVESTGMESNLLNRLKGALRILGGTRFR